MGKINWTRVFLGGLIAGAVITLLHGLLWLMLRDQLSANLPAHMAGLMQPGGRDPKPEFMALYAVVVFALGIVMIWLYAAIRPRYGPGPKTAAAAGVAMWLTLTLADAVWIPLAQFPVNVAVEAIAAYLVIIVVAAVIGAWPYKEESTK